MADDGMGLFGKDQSEIASLKQTLHAQQNLLQKLYNELEEEREASSTAASETLSMILRLQGEMAAVKMEAEQYKRLVEEKMCHAEESLSLFEDLIYQKEMEVASLDYQVQAYRYKLISMGCPDPGMGEIKFPENLLQRNDSVTSSQNIGTLGRRNSAPPQNFKFLNQKKGLMEIEDSTSPDTDLIWNRLEKREGNETVDQSSDNLRRTASSSMTGTDSYLRRTASSSMTGTDSYYEQIRRLEKRVKDVAGVQLRSATSSPSPLPQLSSGNSLDTSRLVSMDESHHAKNRRSSSDDYTDIPGVLDVFEVLPVDPDKKSLGKTVSFAPDSIPDDAPKPEVKYNSEWLKNFVISAREKNLSRPSETAADGNVAIVRPTTRAEICQPNSVQDIRMSEIVEVGNQSIEELSGRREELILLREIKEQLNMIQNEIVYVKTNHSVSKEKQAFATYMETSLIEELEKFYTQ